ncbi:TrmB family transcriptional regulator [Candidatus Woesearchaeota archaeon]|nr:TrmB family transcriptional regulator [Candidatus Woesearchaeota archaeon]
MIVQKDFLNKLKAFGLNTYESKLWTALLSRGVSTAGELSDIANVPRSRSYDVLESLEKKGFIIMKIGKPIKYIAVPPSEVLERVKKKIVEDSATSTRLLDDLKGSEVLSELTLLHNQGVDLVEPSDITGSFRGRSNLYEHLDTMIKSAETSIMIVTSDQGFMRKVETFKVQLEKAKKRGVSIRIAAPLSKGAANHFDRLKGIAEVRDVKGLKARFCVVDGKELLFMLLDDANVHPSYDVGVWVNTELFASAIESMFDVMWKTVQPVKTVKG